MANNSCIRIAVLSLLVILFTSCGPRSFDTSEALWEHLKDSENGYQFAKKVNGVEYVLTYKPTDLMVQQEIGKQKDVARVEDCRKKYGDHMYFNLSMSAEGQELLNHMAGDRSQFGLAVNQLVFGMGDRVHLISKERDTLPLEDYIYPRMYGMGNSTNMLLVYERNDKLLKEDFFHFTIEDLGFATGEVGFKIPTDPIKNEPILDF